MKYDFHRQTLQLHEFGPGRYGGDPEFVPRPSGAAEDDGWVLVLVHDEGSAQTELLVLEAQDLAAPPVARVLLPRRIPYGVHSLWISEAELAT